MFSFSFQFTNLLLYGRGSWFCFTQSALSDAHIVSDSCIELDISENPCKLVSVSTSVLYVPSDALGLLYSFPIPFLDSAFVRLSGDF